MEELIQFPKEIWLGVGSSAFQVEGGWDADGKSPSIQDHYFHKNPLLVTNPSMPHKSSKKHNIQFFHKGSNVHEDVHKLYTVNGDVACDSYNKTDEDINNLVELGVDIYRFSISWTRVLPKGDSRYPNEAGISYYKNLIQKLLDNNIQPLVTMYHWDLPYNLQKIGGLANPLFVKFFSDYATFLFNTFGENVKLWSTINEPRLMAKGYGSDKMAPGIGNDFSGIGDYMSWRHSLLAHAAIYKIYQKSFKEKQQGEICITIDTSAYFPENPDDEEHHKASSRAYDYNMGVFVQPLVNGEYPKSIWDAVKQTNKREGFKIKRLVPFTDEEKEDLIGSYDFIGFNYYNSFNVRPMTDKEYAKTSSLIARDMGFVEMYNVDMNDTFRGFTEVIDWFMKTCGNPALFITENGISEEYDNDDPQTKIKYHHGILKELHKAIENGVNIKGYTIWSFMDSLEWTTGYFKQLFGIYAVDFNHPERPRSKKPSFEFFQQLFKTKTLPPIPQL